MIQCFDITTSCNTLHLFYMLSCMLHLSLSILYFSDCNNHDNTPWPDRPSRLRPDNRGCYGNCHVMTTPRLLSTNSICISFFHIWVSKCWIDHKKGEANTIVMQSTRVTYRINGSCFRGFHYVMWFWLQL